MKNRSAIIIGGGAIGLFTAYFLTLEGIQTTVVDEGSIPGNDSCSTGNAGMLVPSHFIPLANKQTLREGLHSLHKPASPLGIKWSAKPELLGWLWEFYRQSTGKPNHAKTKFLASLHLQSRELYNQIQTDEIPGLTLELSGLAMVSSSPEIFRGDVRTALMAQDLGMPIEIWRNGEFQAQNQELDPQISGAVFYPLDGKVNPQPMLNELTGWLKTRGVAFIENSKVTGWTKERGSITGVITGTGRLSADQYIVCAGAHSGQVLGDLGLGIPLQPAKGISYQFRNPGTTISHPTLLQDHHIAITPYQETTRMAGNFILGDHSAGANGKRLQKIWQNARTVFPAWNIPEPEVRESWSGARPVTPDGMPVIGFSSTYQNLSINAGHAMMGISLAPVSGHLMADWIAGRKTDGQIESFLNPRRFGNRF